MLVIIPILLTYIVDDFIPGNNNLGIKYQLIIALSIPFIGLLMAIFAILKKPEKSWKPKVAIAIFIVYAALTYFSYFLLMREISGAVSKFNFDFV